MVVERGLVVGSRDPGCKAAYYGLIQRWDGHDWKTVPSPQLGGAQGGTRLYSVAAVSADDAWAVGEYYPNASPHSLSLIEHWDGRKWAQVSSVSPEPGGVNRFTTVDAVTPDDVWAIGYDCPPGSPASAAGAGPLGLVSAAVAPAGNRPPGCAGLVERFDGKRWRVVRSGFADMVNDVAGPSADDVWAVGYTGTGHQAVGVVRRFDGHRWRQVYQANQQDGRYGTTVYAVTWLADDDVWAAGYGFNDHRSMLHWDGTKWHRVRMHGPGTIYGAGDVSGSAIDNLWAVATNGQERLLEHWDGARWRSSAYPGEAPDSSYVEGLTATYPDFTWAVGYTASGQDDHSLLLHWTGRKWVNEGRR